LHPARGLNWVSSLHLITGIGSYITSPLWLIFLLVGIMITLQAQFIRPEYFSERSLFPTWPAQDPVRAAWVFAGTMGMLLIPKILGYVALLRTSSARRGSGGAVRAFLSVIVETFVSALIAPVMMLMQSRSMMEIAIGRDSGWQAQRRDDGGLSRAELLRVYGWPTVLGLLLAAGAYAVSLPLFLWMTPVIIGLVFAMPLAAWTSNPRVGEALRSAGFLLTPEESAPPAVLLRANALAAQSEHQGPTAAVVALIENEDLARAHRAMQPAAGRQRGAYDVDLLVGLAKIDDADTLEDAIAALSKKETFAVLGSRDALDRLGAKRRH
jgi:membrane glycosyltransferase